MEKHKLYVSKYKHFLYANRKHILTFVFPSVYDSKNHLEVLNSILPLHERKQMWSFLACATANWRTADNKFFLGPRGEKISRLASALASIINQTRAASVKEVLWQFKTDVANSNKFLLL